MLLPDLPQREAPWAKHSSALLGGSTTLRLQGGAEVTLTHRPLSLEARLDGKPALRFNSEGMLNYEHRREKQARCSATVVCICGEFRIRLRRNPCEIINCASEGGTEL